MCFAFSCAATSPSLQICPPPPPSLETQKSMRARTASRQRNKRQPSINNSSRRETDTNVTAACSRPYGCQVAHLANTRTHPHPHPALALPSPCPRPALARALAAAILARPPPPQPLPLRCMSPLAPCREHQRQSCHAHTHAHGDMANGFALHGNMGVQLYSLLAAYFGYPRSATLSGRECRVQAANAGDRQTPRGQDQQVVGSRRCLTGSA